MLWVVSAWQPWDYKPLVSHVESGDDPTLGGRWAERWAVQMLPPQIHSWDMLQTSKCVWMIKRTAEIKNILNSLPHEITKIHAKNPTSWQHSLVAWSRICPFILRARNYSPGGEWERRSSNYLGFSLSPVFLATWPPQVKWYLSKVTNKWVWCSGV